MLNRFKSALNNVINTLEPSSTQGLANGAGDGQQHHHNHHVHKSSKVGVGQLKFAYSRPDFLSLESNDEIQVSADHIIRPIIVPRDITKLPFNSGYAECINAGKSVRNEDHASVYRGLLRAVVTDENIYNKVSDMMPNIPGHPHQIPVGKRFVESKSLQDIKEVTKSETNGNIDIKTDVKEANGSEVEPKSDSKDIKEVQSLPLNPYSLGFLTSPTDPVPNDVQMAESLDLKNDSLDGNETRRALARSQTSPLITSESSEKTKKYLTEESLPWIQFAVFDGHAGSGVAVAVSNTLHQIIQEKLQTISDLLIKFGLNYNQKHVVESDAVKRVESKRVNGSVVINQDNHLMENHSSFILFEPSIDKMITIDNLITGALESAFWEMDRLIARDKEVYRMSGGCTACVAVFILGKLYVVNAGDSRATICRNEEVIPMSFDFTPESERERIKYLGLLKPELLGNDFTHLEFVRRPSRRDLGKKLLYRDAFMTGWAYKSITIEDLKFPLIYGEGKRSRVLATIGVTRGFGDHELKAQNSDVDIKPFLTPQPEVRIYDLENDHNLTDEDVLVIGTDGLWDITTNEDAAHVIKKSLDLFPVSDTQRYKYRYISAAQDLVMHSRGKSPEKGRGWKTLDNKMATIDDISVFVIPLKPFREEYINWKCARSVGADQECSDR